MPPEVLHYRSLVIPLLKISSAPTTISPDSDQLNSPPQPAPAHKYPFRGAPTMKFPARKLLPLLVFLLSSFSIFRLLRIALTTSSSSSSSSIPPPLLPLPSSTSVTRSVTTRLSQKEFKHLSNLVKSKAPCNLLIFGLGKQYLKLSSINSGGNTLFLEDDSEKIIKFQSKSNATSIYKVEYPVPANKAYELLKHARQSPECGRPAKASSLLLLNSTCRLVLKTLPRQVYEYKWDVVVMDGPTGDAPDVPGRMSSIYTAGVIARASHINVTTDVVVHDVHRTIEKWFSWEFLCQHNMVSSKGKLWSFRIKGEPTTSDSFCPD